MTEVVAWRYSIKIFANLNEKETHLKAFFFNKLVRLDLHMQVH